MGGSVIGRNQREEDQGETGYSWFSFNGGCSQVVRLLFTFIVIGGGIAFYIWYSRNSDDASPDSIAGYGYAIVGTLFVVLAGIRFTRRRRSHKGGAIGHLNASLQWHLCLGLEGLGFLFLHSFGIF